MSTNGLVVLAIPSRMTWEDWTARVKNVAMVKKKLPFYIGDLLLIGEQTFGEKASQFLNEFGYSEGALDNFRWVAKKFAPEERCDLPWSWHQAAAKLPKRERDKALTAALAGELNRAGIRALVNGGKVNGASNGSDAPESLPDAKTAAFEALGLEMAQVGRMFKWAKVTDEEWRNALDELIEKTMAAREHLGEHSVERH
jgi:hypothetical protein